MHVTVGKGKGLAPINRMSRTFILACLITLGGITEGASSDLDREIHAGGVVDELRVLCNHLRDAGSVESLLPHQIHATCLPLGVYLPGVCHTYLSPTGSLTALRSTKHLGLGFSCEPHSCVNHLDTLILSRGCTLNRTCLSPLLTHLRTYCSRTRTCLVPTARPMFKILPTADTGMDTDKYKSPGPAGSRAPGARTRSQSPFATPFSPACAFFSTYVPYTLPANSPGSVGSVRSYRQFCWFRAYITHFPVDHLGSLEGFSEHTHLRINLPRSLAHLRILRLRAHAHVAPSLHFAHFWLTTGTQGLCVTSPEPTVFYCPGPIVRGQPFVTLGTYTPNLHHTPGPISHASYYSADLFLCITRFLHYMGGESTGSQLLSVVCQYGEFAPPHLALLSDFMGGPSTPCSRGQAPSRPAWAPSVCLGRFERCTESYLPLSHLFVHMLPLRHDPEAGAYGVYVPPFFGDICPGWTLLSRLHPPLCNTHLSPNYPGSESVTRKPHCGV